MTKFMAVKVHYDHRPRLPLHLKYSALPTEREYQEYLDLYRTEGIGGHGFHECLNFQIPDDASVKMYLPPTCIPSDIDQEYVIFSFTYRQDREKPDSIVGVHAAAQVLSKEGLARRGVPGLAEIDPLSYHVEAPADFVTLFTPPLAYDRLVGEYTPRFSQWGYGLRYIQEDHAARIVSNAVAAATVRSRQAPISEAVVIERQIRVLRRIVERYGLDVPEVPDDGPTLRTGNEPPLPNPDIGWLGERLVYENELEHATNLGLEPSRVEWVSQSDPLSPFDIKSVRKKDGKLREHFIEVKTTSSSADWNIFLSARQVEFLSSLGDRATFKFVILGKQSPPQITELSWQQLTSEFSLEPIKFRLRRK